MAATQSALPHDNKVRVLIADDHPPTRAGIRHALLQGGFGVCAEVASGPEAVEEARRLRPHICLLDVHMPGGGGVEAAEAITRELADTLVVMLTVSREDEHLFGALKAGVVGYLPKDIHPDRLTSSLWGVIRGEAALPRRLMARVIEEFQARGNRRLRLPDGRSVSLSAREWEVLQGLREGLSTRQIADRLHVAPVTVRTHVAALLRKIRAPDRSAAVRLLGEER